MLSEHFIQNTLLQPWLLCACAEYCKGYEFTAGVSYT